MSLTEGDKNTCREIAREIIKEVMKEHVSNCPNANEAKLERQCIIQAVALGKAKIAGIIIGVSIATSLLTIGSGVGVIKLLAFVSKYIGT